MLPRTPEQNALDIIPENCKIFTIDLKELLTQVCRREEDLMDNDFLFDSRGD